MYPKSENCLEHPLGILCKCKEHQEILNKFMFYSIGSRHYSLPKMNIGEQKNKRINTQRYFKFLDLY